MRTEDYRVDLEAFRGPLDLLLFLIRRAEVDITDIPVAVIADQYLEFLEGIERIDIEQAGEFLVMAATLMEIKSRMLAPAAPSGGESEQGSGETVDPRADLVKQLLAYKRYRDAADALDERRREWEQRYPAACAPLDDESLQEASEALGGVEIEDVSLVDLVEAFGRIMESVNLDRMGDHRVVFDDTPIELHADDLLDRLKRDSKPGGGMALTAVFAGRNRSEMIGLFLAMLELVRQRKVTVRQGDVAGEIEVGLRAEE